MGKCSGRSMALLAPTLSLVEITPAPAANPSKLAVQARRYCRRQGGEVQTRVPTFGAGGGWVEEHDKDVPVLEACVFPDQSVIDSFGIFYQARGIVRGVDLTTSFAYQSDNPPFVFGD